MCGICGVWGPGAPGSEPAVKAMVQAMRHRGPDDHGIYSQDPVCLGQSRLKVIDLSPAAHQPMANPAGDVWIVYNGETYNFLELRAQLEAKGHEFRSNSDTEVVLRLYEEHGDDFLLKMRGMFALAVFDRRSGPGRERLLLARDQLGIKPLLYSQTSGGLVFASEIRALLTSNLVQRRIDPQGLRTLLTFGSVQQPGSIIQGVSMLPPAHRLIAQGGQVRMEPYWSPGLDRVAGLRQAPYEEQVAALADTLAESVRLQMVSDVPIGAFLSGGVDSSLTVALMARAAGSRVKTYSVGFQENAEVDDESGEAMRTAEFLGADHTSVIITGDEVAGDIMDIAAGLDQPSVDGTNSYLVSRAARQGVTVAISGTGGDELFAGYPWFAQMAQYEAQGSPSSLPGRLLASPQFDRFMLSRWGARLKALRDRAGFLAVYANTYFTFGDLGAARLLHPDLRAAARAGRGLAQDLAPTDQLPQAPAVERVSALCLRGYTNNQLLRDIDAASMTHALEVRVPFLDVPLLDLALSLPPETKLGPPDAKADPHRASYRDLGGKRILVEAGVKNGLLPPGIDLQPKRGFNMPNRTWLLGPLRETLLESISDASILQRGWLEPTAVAGIRQGFLNGNFGWTQPWLLMMLELWARQVLDPAP